jgi:hypothetical protein
MGMTNLTMLLDLVMGQFHWRYAELGKGKKTRTKAKVMATGGWMHGCMDIREEKAKESTE